MRGALALAGIGVLALLGLTQQKKPVPPAKPLPPAKPSPHSPAKRPKPEMPNMDATSFALMFWPSAVQVQDQYRVPALVTIGQAALESGWGKHMPRNNMFGIKAPSSWTGLRQLLTTTEYHNGPNVKYPVVISVEEVKPGRYRYLVRDYFKAFLTPAEAFADHANLLKKRYAFAFKSKDAYQFAEAIAGKYATDPDYANKLTATMRKIEKILVDNRLVA